MEASMERMPIACVHCAKAKAKCDKKVPCSRCVTKQVLCQSRPTRRSSNMASRRANAARSRPESFHASGRFHLSEFSHSDVNRNMLRNDMDLDVFNLVNRGCSFGIPQYGGHASHRSLPSLDYTGPFGGGAGSHDPEPELLRNGFSTSPPDASASITPIEQEYPRLDDLMPMPDNWDQTAYDHLLSLGGESDLSAAFEMANMLDFMGPHQISTDFMEPASKVYSHTYRSMEPPRPSPRSERSSICPEGSMDLDSSAESVEQPIVSNGLDGLLASQESWPFFACNRVPKSGCFPPATAGIYVEGLIRVLTTYDWQLPHVAQHGDAAIAANELLQGEEALDPLIGRPADSLNAAARAILHKACSTHRAEQSSLDSVSNLLVGKDGAGTIQLPPPDAMARFVESYITHHKPYYACAADLTHSSVPMLQSNVQASRLLMLMTIAQGAAFISIPEARYLASGLIEACRLFLFDSIEKDILLSRDPTVLHSALLFTTAAAWSGDNWHMDIAMGQRGMYLAMMSHARMFIGQERHSASDDLPRDLIRSWEEWRICEEKRRISYSWVILDQELSLFSDTTPLLNVVDLQAPMPTSEHVWDARSADEWASRRQEVFDGKAVDGLSLRDLFTRFVEGDISSSDTRLSPLQLRLLLHPLQNLVCQLRQFLTCLPDSGRQPLGTSISKVAIKARLEEISTLLRQWYGFTEKHIDGEGRTCLTTRANLIMYHLICLNTRTGLGFIEQFARGEVSCASARQAAQWLNARCIDDPEQVNFHCGQILRLSQSIPENMRPPWWAGAVYRAALVAWATSMASVGSRLSVDMTAETDRPFAIDALRPGHSSIEQYLRFKEGVPMLSKRDGSLVAMNAPNNILQHCISILEGDLSTRATEGIARKLQCLLQRWRKPPFEVKS